MREFRLHGCRLRSELTHPLLVASRDPAGAEDVVLARGEVPSAFDEPLWETPFASVASDGTALVRLPAVGAFLLRAGREILVSEGTAGRVALDLMLLRPVAAMLLHQRGALPLRATCVALEGRAVAIVAPPATGASTLGLALLRRGGRLLGDGVSAVRFAGTKVLVDPGGASLSLWPDAQALLGDGARWEPVRAGHAKLVARFETGDSSPLVAIVRLVPAANRRPELRRLHGPEAAMPIGDLVSQFSPARALGRAPALFAAIMRLAAMLPIYELRQPPIEHVGEAADWIAEAVRAA